ncbi:autotransporter domain-containing protein, partial [Xanthobacter agilis]
MLSAVSLGALLASMPPARAGEVIDGGTTVTVPGTYSSPWNVDDVLYVGYSGTGTLTIEDGGTVTSETAYIGFSSGSSGTVTVTGADSSWDTWIYDLYVGYYGTGTLTISDGGTVTSRSGYIGYKSGSTGKVTVTGADSSWGLGTSTLYVGSAGTGTLTISDGGTVTSGLGYIGFSSGSSGTVTVTGADSSWDLGTSNLFVGRFSTGTLTISDGGAVTNGTTYIGYGSGSSGTLNLNGTTGARGVLTTGQVVAGSGTVLLNFDGGVLQASANSSDFLSGFTSSSVEILSGGAFIDSNGYAITIATALDGVGSLTKQGE